MNTDAQQTRTQKKIGLILAVLSIVILVAGLLFGYVLAVAAFLGAYAVLVGIRTKSVLIIIIGAIGTLLNLGLYIFSVVTK